MDGTMAGTSERGYCRTLCSLTADEGAGQCSHDMVWDEQPGGKGRPGLGREHWRRLRAEQQLDGGALIGVAVGGHHGSTHHLASDGAQESRRRRHLQLPVPRARSIQLLGQGLFIRLRQT